FDRVLRQSPEFFHDYDPGQLSAIINQMTIETEMTLRQIIVDPILQFVVLAGTTCLVSYNFVQLHKEPLAIFGFELPSWAIPPMVLSPSQALSGYPVMASSSWPNIEQVINTLESRSKTEEQPGTMETQVAAPTIEARNVVFSYEPSSSQIFDQLSFTVPPGK